MYIDVFSDVMLVPKIRRQSRRRLTKCTGTVSHRIVPMFISCRYAVSDNIWCSLGAVDCIREVAITPAAATEVFRGFLRLFQADACVVAAVGHSHFLYNAVHFISLLGYGRRREVNRKRCCSRCW